MPLAPCDFLAAVGAAVLAPDLCRLHRLTINTRRTRRRLPAGFPPDLLPQRRHQLGPGAIIAPLGEIVIHAAFEAQLDRYRQTFTGSGHGEPTDDLPHVFWTHLADTTEQALEEAGAGMKRKLGSSTKVWAKPGTGGGYEAFAKVGQFLATATIDQLDALSIFGDPPRCLEKVKRYHAAGIRHLLVMFDWGGMPKETIFHSMELFAKYVMPHFREEPATVSVDEANTADRLAAK